MGTVAIETNQLTKAYAQRRKNDGPRARLFSLIHRTSPAQQYALRDVTFTIEQGTIAGLIGANGAGKSTAIKLITGILHPSSGTVTVFDGDPTKQRRKNAYRFGLMMGQRSQLWWDLPARDSLELFRRMYGVSQSDYRQMMSTFGELLELDAFVDSPVRHLSLGQRMRCELAATLLHRPEILFLDEPTIGIDVLAKERILNFIRKINREWGVTVLLTTHDIGDMEQVAQRLLILDRGQLLFDGHVDGLRQLETLRRVDVEFGTDVAHFEFPLVRVSWEGPRKVQLLLDRNTVSIASLIANLLENHPVIDISIQAPDIETVVRRIYQTSSVPIAEDV